MTPDSQAAHDLAPLPLLASPGSYRACDWDLLVDDAGRAAWLAFFRSHWATMRRMALESGYDEAAIDAAGREVQARVDALETDPRALGDRLDILALDEMRDGALRRHGVDDPCRAVKRRENEAALALLPRRLAELDALEGDARRLEQVRGVFAGNLFDMGAQATADRFGDAPPSFASCVAQIAPRPWLHDGVEAMRFDRRKAVLFVDNAGGDVVLGMLPLARELLARGGRVVLAANSGPSLNDITAAELEEIVGRASAFAPHLRDGTLRVVATGTRAPLIDLSAVSRGLREAAADADLVVLEGMGRALESNWDAAMTCEVWRLAIIKDEKVAGRRGGRLYDCVCRVVEGAV